MRRQHLSLRRLNKERRRVRLPIYERPKTRGDCAEGLRPCPFVGCRYHLGLETKAGALRISCETAEEMEQMEETCSLDVAERGPNTLPDVASLLGVSRQRVSQVEIAALRKLKAELIATAGPAIAELLPGLFNDEGDDPEEEGCRVDDLTPWQ